MGQDTRQHVLHTKQSQGCPQVLGTPEDALWVGPPRRSFHLGSAQGQTFRGALTPGPLKEGPPLLGGSPSPPPTRPGIPPFIWNSSGQG